MRYWMKIARSLLLLSGCMLSGCVNGPLPEKAAWPWEDGHGQAENYFSIRGNVANFDAPPTAVKPVSTESPESRSPDTNPAPEAAAMKTQPPAVPALGQTGSDKIHDNLKREYDFTVRDIKTAPPTYLPMDSIRTGHDITEQPDGVENQDDWSRKTGEAQGKSKEHLGAFLRNVKAK